MNKLDDVIRSIEYGKELLQHKSEQDTIDYKIWEILDDCLELLKYQQLQIHFMGLTIEEYGKKLRRKYESKKA